MIKYTPVHDPSETSLTSDGSKAISGCNQVIIRNTGELDVDWGNNLIKAGESLNVGGPETEIDETFNFTFVAGTGTKRVDFLKVTYNYLS